ncbi:MAG: type I-E CRISPR-associated protein Cse1/CasA [Lentisphaerae bacterium]|nr:type I-E CRISPR-associated protein Cse1/CasA [Lentisphaerota bacterium]
MSYNLIHEPWIPVRRQNGRSDWIAPWQITEGADRPVALDAVRPDFNGALIQFLIGLTQTCFAPENDREWRKHLKTPPAPEVLRDAFSKYAHAFNLDGDGPRFMQDSALTDDKKWPVDTIFLDGPGKETLRDNADFFVKRGRVETLGPEAAAAALFALQTNAPANAYYASGVRGGGPLTTLVLGPTLWHTVWLNTLVQQDFYGVGGNKEKRDDGDIFPWLATRAATTEKVLVPDAFHPAHMYWGMPWRVKLLLSAKSGTCNVTGRRTELCVSDYCKEKSLARYRGWLHALSPFSEKRKGEKHSCKPDEGQICYRHWLGLVFGDKRQKKSVASVVHRFHERKAHPDWRDVDDIFRTPPRLWAFGYVMGKMKARVWREGVLPLLTVPEKIREPYDHLIRRCIVTADVCRKLLRGSIFNGLFRPSERTKKRVGKIDQQFWEQSATECDEHTEEVSSAYDEQAQPILRAADEQFWHETGQDFEALLYRGLYALEKGQSCDPTKTAWFLAVRGKAMTIFDDIVQTQQLEVVNPRRVALALIGLKKALSENSRSLREMLDLPVTAHAKKIKRKTT